MKRAIQILKKLNQPDRVINRDRVNFTKLMDHLGHPYRQFRSIHITGTNGKGSVATKTASILQKSGLNVGLYTSPHLFTFRQRIKVNSQMIGQNQIAEYIIKIDQISQKQKIPLSYFEVLTAGAFLHFRNQKCDYVSLEVGLGGRNDTTNIVDPEISVITSIGLDHMDLLGPTIQHISKEKAGIIKPNRPVVLGSTAQNAPILDAAKQNRSQVYQVGVFDDFQTENKEISRKTIEVLQILNPSLQISQQIMNEGLSAEMSCRMQKLPLNLKPKYAQSKQIYFDVGHNPAAMEKIKNSEQLKKYKKQQISVVFGSSRGKNFDESLSIIQQFAGYIYIVEANHFRAASIKDLQRYISFSRSPHKFRQIADGNIQTTLQHVTADSTCKCLIICGSFFMMPQARGFFEPEILKYADQCINEVYQLKQK